MYCILMDKKTGSFYMDPKEIRFYGYTDPEEYNAFYKNAKLVELDIDEYREFATYLYNAGFVNGYLNGKPVRIKKGDVLFYKQNCNEIVFSQYVLTGDDNYLKMIKKSSLVTLCQIDNSKCTVYFPTVKLEDGTNAVLAYTDISRIPPEMRKKYQGWRTVRMTFNTVCIVNGMFVAV
ncbi:MAG: hypothetical protein IKM88_15580 [Lachnospiraceae bacterium]|nr:hypothetical protein [Lachnospiraceae bacterium]MBR6851643.1 hypothetical protein [Lachnospiraceae bacterium]